jgi:hypothetical protein
LLYELNSPLFNEARSIQGKAFKTVPKETRDVYENTFKLIKVPLQKPKRKELSSNSYRYEEEEEETVDQTSDFIDLLKRETYNLKNVSFKDIFQFQDEKDWFGETAEANPEVRPNYENNLDF